MNSFFPSAALSPEMQLLCACCRVQPRAEDLQSQAALAAQVNADKLIALAIRQRVEPLLYHNLKQHAHGVFPDQVLDTLAARVRRNTFNSLNAIRLNVQLARLLREHGIPYLPLKGVTLAQRYYHEISLRQTNDIDFWVPIQFVKTVRQLLLEQGCQPQEEYDVRGEIELHRLQRARMHHIGMTYPNGMQLEVHWRLTLNCEALRLDAANLLASGETVEMASETLTMMAAVPLLLYLCEHGARHGWWRLKWLMDLPQVLESRDWDWPQVLAEAKRANCLNSLLLGLKLAQRLFGWAAPPTVVAAMSRQYLLDWQTKMVCQYLGKPERALSKLTVAQKIYRLSLADSASFVWNELSRRQYWLYYGMRSIMFGWLRLLRRKAEQSAE